MAPQCLICLVLLKAVAPLDADGKVNDEKVIQIILGVGSLQGERDRVPRTAMVKRAACRGPWTILPLSDEGKHIKWA